MGQSTYSPTVGQTLAQGHTDGLSWRALGTLHNLPKTTAQRWAERYESETEAAPPPTAEAPTDPPFPTPPSPIPPIGNREPDREPQATTKLPPETEFPGNVPGFLPDDLPDYGIVIEPDANELRRQKQEAARAKRAIEDAENERERRTRVAAHEAELRAAVNATKVGTPEWTQTRGKLSRYLKSQRGRSFGPMPSETGVQVSSQTLRDGPPPNLWDNPYDRGPRGFQVLGS